MTKFGLGGSGGGVNPPAPGRSSDRVLIVEVAGALPDSIICPYEPRIVRLPYADLSPTVIQMIAPDVVVAPLFCANFDILDLMKLLRLSGFAGSLVVLTDNLPDPRSVEAEITRTPSPFTTMLVPRETPGSD